MPPPTTGLQQAKLTTQLAWYRAARWVNANAMLLRLTLFAAKVLSLSWVCFPYSAGWAVTAIVVGLAAGDLHLALRDEEGSDTRARERSVERTAERPRLGSWNGVESLERAGEGLGLLGQSEDGERTKSSDVARQSDSGWRRSLVFLLLHCFVLASMNSLGAMCAGEQVPKGWEDWRAL